METRFVSPYVHTDSAAPASEAMAAPVVGAVSDARAPAAVGPSLLARQGDGDTRPAQTASSVTGLQISCPHCHGLILVERLAVRGLAAAPREPELELEVGAPGTTLDDVLDAVQRGVILLALHAARGVKARAAHVLGTRPSSMWEAMDRLGMIGVTDLAMDGLDPSAFLPLDHATTLGLRFRDETGSWLVQVDLSERQQLLRRVTQAAASSLASRFLERTGGNAARAARLAGLKYTTFYQLVRRLGLVAKVVGPAPTEPGSQS